MADMQEAVHHATSQERATMLEGSMSELLIGIGSVVLAIIALIGFLPEVLVSITAIAMGVAFVFEGAAISREISDVLAESTVTMSSLGYGVTVEFLAGVIGVALGILSLVNVAPMVLLPVAGIVYGAGLIAGTGMTNRLSKIAVQATVEEEAVLELSREAIAAASYVRLFIGVGAMTLGVLALIGLSPLVLSIIALLGVAFSQMVNGGSMSGRLMSLFSRY